MMKTKTVRTIAIIYLTYYICIFIFNKTPHILETFFAGMEFEYLSDFYLTKLLINIKNKEINND